MVALIVIIILDVIIVGLLLYWGTKHDAHNEIRSPESSKAVQILAAQTAAIQAARAEAARSEETPAEVLADVPAAVTTEAVEEAKARAETALEEEVGAVIGVTPEGKEQEPAREKSRPGARVTDEESPLGDEDARKKRREEALKRKAARQSQKGGE